MKLRDLMQQLGLYNQDADVAVVVHNRRESFSISFGDSEGVTKETCNTVGFYVDALNGQEDARCTLQKV